MSPEGFLPGWEPKTRPDGTVCKGGVGGTWRCPVHGDQDHYVVPRGNVLIGCPQCGRLVTQVEADLPDGEPF